MKAIAWLAGFATLLIGAAYMVISLNRWEWNRALFFGLIVLIAEVGLAAALILRRLGQVQPRQTMIMYMGAALGVVAAVAVLLPRDATLSIHQPVDQDSRIELVIHVSTKGGEAGQTVAEMAEVQLLTCRLEVSSDPVMPLEDLGEGRFRVILAPSMDTTDQRQFRGRLEDWAIDHVRSDVELLEPIE